MTRAIIAAATLALCCPDDEPECLPATPATTCESHPFGPAIECGSEREPQTTEKCLQVLEANPGLCETDYVACREAMRIAECGVCPSACEGIAC